MAGEVQYILGGVALPYALFEWPKYRGTMARQIELHCPAKMYPQLEALAKSLKGAATFFEVSGPDKSGNRPGTATVRIEGVYILRVALMSDQVCKVILVDRRILLSRRVAALDFNQSFGDGFLNGTEFSSIMLALLEWLKQEPTVSGNTDSGSIIRTLLGFPYNGKDYFSGLTLPMALGEFADRNNFDVVCWNNGKMALATRKDISGAAELPLPTAYDWQLEPGWLTLAGVVLHRPKKVKKYYFERHCIRMEGGDPNATIATRGPDELVVRLEQVYSDGGTIKTLAQLLTTHNFASTDLTDAQIAGSFWTENFQGAPIAASFGTDDFDAVHKAVRDGWRRLWRIQYPESRGHLGGWTDWDFGKINSDGSVQPVSVECPYVEFLNVPSTDQGHFVGARTTVNHAAPAPFFPTWEGDVSNGVVRLNQKPLPDQNIAMPGALNAPLVIQKTLNPALKDAAGGTYDLRGYDVIESQPWSMAKFDADFEIKVYLCATRRMPNNRSRWHVEEADAFNDGDIDDVELPVSQHLYCVRDYVDVTSSAHMPTGDGLGPILNRPALTGDAKTSATAWMLTHAAALEGVGIAESIMLFRDKEVSGPILEIVLVGTLEGPNQAPVVRTRIVVGNLSDEEQRKRYGVRRLAERNFKEAGVQ